MIHVQHTTTTFAFETQAGQSYSVKFVRTPTQKKQVTVWEGDEPIYYLPHYYGAIDSISALHILEQGVKNHLLDEMQKELKTA